MILLHWMIGSNVVDLDQSSFTNWILHLEVELEMLSTLLTSFKLTIEIYSLHCNEIGL